MMGALSVFIAAGTPPDAGTYVPGRTDKVA